MKEHLPLSNKWQCSTPGACTKSATNACRGRTAVYWAVLSHSVEVLNVLCAHATKAGASLHVSQPDHMGTAPLDIAVASQQWRTVNALVRHGGLKVRPCSLVFSLFRFRAEFELLLSLSCRSQTGIGALSRRCSTTAASRSVRVVWFLVVECLTLCS